MKNRFLIVLALVSALFIGVGTAQAATSAIDNLPGGAGIAYFHTSAAGDLTLLNIQNKDTIPIMVHVTFYDQNSEHVIDFTIPLSAYDNWGAAITGDGTNITISPQTPCFGGFGGANDGCFAPLVTALGAGSDGLQKGYVTMTVTAGDSLWYSGNADGDPRNDPIWTIANFRHWDTIFARTALLNPTSGSAIALNATMLQGFVNIGPILDEAANGFDSIGDAAIPMNYDCDGNATDTWASIDDPGFGMNIDSWEIFLTNWGSWDVVADDVNADGEGEVIYNAVGSANTAYWGRYNEDPAVGSETLLITLFPANSGTGHVPPCNYSSRVMSIQAFDDNEFPISTPYTPAEVDRVAFGPAGITVPGTSGEAQIIVDAPLIGFTYTEVGNYADLYPLVREAIWVNTTDFFFWSGHAPDPLVSEVIQIGLQESEFFTP